MLKRILLSGILLAAIFTFLMLAGACQSKKKISVDFLQTDSLVTDTVSIQYQDDTFSKIPEEQSSINISYPKFPEGFPAPAIDSIQLAINQFIVGSDTIPSADTLAKKFFADYADTKKNFGNEFPWTLTRNIAVASKIKPYLSVAFFEDSYMGGAHPNSFTIYKVFDLQTGKQLHLNDFLLADKKDEVDKLKLEYLNIARKNDVDSSDFSTNLFEEALTPKTGSLYTNDNFYLTAKGLVIYYNSYDIAAYAYGPSEVLIPWEKLIPFIQPTHPLLKYISAPKPA